MSNIQAVIYILKTLIDLGMYLTKMIKREQFEQRLRVMDDYIHRASNGELGARLEAGREIEDRINSHTRRRP
jgi:hypothetical protein